jgi:photosystem II stability/assembly factor-like uncharacterized protein
MSDRLHVATRKGLFAFERRGSRWQITGTAFLGDPVSMVFSDLRDGTLYAGLNLGHFGVKLHRSADGGGTWEEITAPTYPPNPEETATRETEGDPAKAPSVKQIWAMESAGADRPGELWIGTIPGGLFHSRDRGDSWTLNQSLWDHPGRSKWMGGGADQPGLHSVVVDPRDTRRVTLGVSVGGVWHTADGGDTWEVKSDGMFAAYMPPEMKFEAVAQDPHRIVACPAAPDTLWCQHHNGAFRSTDRGRSWTELPVPPSVFGFGVAAHPTDPLTAWFVPAVKDECRIPVDGKVVAARTRDGGRTFEVLREGLPQEHAYDLVFRHALDIDDTGDRLAMGSTTGALWITEDQGDRWQTLSTHLPPVYCVRFEK